MLDYRLSVTVSDQAWNSASAHAALPKPSEDFFAEYGATSVAENTRRRYRRMRVRGRAIAYRGSDQYGVFTNDVSPVGIGFFSPVQLLPKEEIEIFFEEFQQLQVEIRRVVRTDQQCFFCGGEFLSGPMPPGAYQSFLTHLKV